MEKTRRPWPLLAALSLIYILALRAYYVGFFNDDAFYIIGARSLLHGRYAELSSPGAPPLVNYLPGYPLLLCPLLWLFPGSLLPCQLFSIALTLGALFLFWIYFSDSLSPEARWAAVAAAGLSPLTVSLSGAVLSDVPYLFLTAAILLAAKRCWRASKAEPRRTNAPQEMSCALVRASRPEPWIALSGLSAFAFYLRPSGAAFPLALIASLMLARRWRLAGLCAAVSLPLMAWFPLRNHWLGAAGLTYARELAAPYQGSQAWARLMQAAWRNVLFYPRELFAGAVFRWPSVSGMTWLKFPTAILGLLIAAAGGKATEKSKGNYFALLYLAIYSAVHLLWDKQSGRYILPILPLALGYLFAGLAWIAQRLSQKPRSWVLGGLALNLMLCAGPDVHILTTSLMRSTPVNTPPERTFAWIRKNTRAQDIFAAELDGRLYLYTERPTLHLLKIHDPAEFKRWIQARGIRYVLVFPTDFILRTFQAEGPHDPLPVAKLMELLSDRSFFRPVFQDSSEGSLIYQAA